MIEQNGGFIQVQYFVYCSQITTSKRFSRRHWLVLTEKMIWCVFDCVSTNIQTATEAVHMTHPFMHLFLAYECVSKVPVGAKGFRLAYQRYLWNVPSWRGASAHCDPSHTVCSCPRHASSSERQEHEELVFAAALAKYHKGKIWLLKIKGRVCSLHRITRLPPRCA